jgi:hypothetical protein
MQRGNSRDPLNQQPADLLGRPRLAELQHRRLPGGFVRRR